jgi:3-deoxy-D-manno-octulosonic-acid transferase
MMRLYGWIMTLLTPFFYFLLWRRLKEGKEVSKRVCERFGIATQKREKGNYIWVHAASVGESMMIFPLIEKISTLCPHLRFVVTTTTVPSAQLLAQRLPPHATHQFFPLDQPQWVNRFLSYWEPALVLWAESEFWPTVFHHLKKSEIPLFIISAGLSESSFKKWRYASSLIKETMSGVTRCFARSPLQTDRLTSLGVPRVETVGNMKFSVPPLGVAEDSLCQFQNALGTRPVWVAASTHRGEEELILRAHEEIKKICPTILTILVPRHPTRGPEIQEKIGAFCPADRLLTRSKGEIPTPFTEIYLVDTLGELGLFYRLAPVAFVGGSLIPQGGHNPIEPLQLDCIPLYGPHMDNFQEVLDTLEEDWFQVRNEEELAAKVLVLLGSPKIREQYKIRMTQILKDQEEMSQKIIQTLLPFLRELHAPQDA